MARFALILSLSALNLVSTACRSDSGPEAGVRQAYSDLWNAEGKNVGNATLTEAERGGVWIDLQVSQLPQGEYQLQIHEFAKCEPPEFLSAGGRFPASEQAASRKMDFLVPEDGSSQSRFLVPSVTLDSDNEDLDRSLFHPGGTSLVVYEFVGDRAGARIACGAVSQTPRETARPVGGDLETGKQPDELGHPPGERYRQPATD